jgi:hypothetical protein
MTEPPRTESELVELVRSSDVRAPESLHRQVDVLVASRRPRRSRGFAPPRRLLGTMAAAAVAGAIVAALTGGSSAVSVREASALTLLPATSSAPRESTTRRAQLSAAVEGVPFPYWGERFGWHGSGARTDRLDGRTVTTVFYTDVRGRRVGYAIASGTVPTVSGGVAVRRHGVDYRLLSENGASVVTWLRDGHLCVVSGRGLDTTTLLRLASWDDRGSAA